MSPLKLSPVEPPWYGPVCPVVWEGWCREASPYPDQSLFDSQKQNQTLVRTFLVRFDAIFTLNQGLLLERHYLDDNIMLSQPRRWNGWQMPRLSPQFHHIKPRGRPEAS